MTYCTPDQFRELQLRIEGAYRVVLTKPQLDSYWSIWSHFPYDVLAEALSRWMAAPDGKFFPTAPALVPLADRIWAEQVKQNHDAKRQDERRGWRQITDQTRDDVGSLAISLIQSYFDGKMTKEVYVQGLRTMHARWPTLGFDRAADEVMGLSPYR